MTHYTRATDTIATRPSTLDEVVASLIDAYEIDEPTCRAEAEAFLADMTAKRLIVASE